MAFVVVVLVQSVPSLCNALGNPANDLPVSSPQRRRAKNRQPLIRSANLSPPLLTTPICSPNTYRFQNRRMKQKKKEKAAAVLTSGTSSSGSSASASAGSQAPSSMQTHLAASSSALLGDPLATSQANTATGAPVMEQQQPQQQHPHQQPQHPQLSQQPQQVAQQQQQQQQQQSAPVQPQPQPQPPTHPQHHNLMHHQQVPSREQSQSSQQVSSSSQQVNQTANIGNNLRDSSVNGLMGAEQHLTPQQLQQMHQQMHQSHQANGNLPANNANQRTVLSQPTNQVPTMASPVNNNSGNTSLEYIGCHESIR